MDISSEEQIPEERMHSATVELEEMSPLELLDDVQQILTKMLSPGIHAENTSQIWHEQTRTALNLLLRAISTLKREERKKGK
jgi:hypothetical protein